MEQVIIIILGMEHTIIHVLLPGDMVFTIIHILGGAFMLDLVMVGFDGVFILIIDTIGDLEVTDTVIDMDIIVVTAMELVLVTGRDIEPDKETLIEMYIIIDQEV